MIFWYFLIVVSLIWLIFASVTDIKKREVPDWLSYSLITIGLGSRLIYSFMTKDFSYIVYGIIGIGVFFLIAMLMYYTKQWGGGDAKLLMGLGAMFGNYSPIFNSVNKLPFLATLIINILIAGAFYGIFYCIGLGIKNHKAFSKEIKNHDFRFLKIFNLVVLVLILLDVIIFKQTLLYIILFALISLVIAINLIYFIKIVENISFYKYLEVNKLTEGDWLVNEVKKNNKVIVNPRNIGLTKKDIEILKKNNIKKVLVKEGIPFVPAFLIGFIITIILGDIIFLII